MGFHSGHIRIRVLFCRAMLTNYQSAPLPSPLPIPAFFCAATQRKQAHKGNPVHGRFCQARRAGQDNGLEGAEWSARPQAEDHRPGSKGDGRDGVHAQCACPAPQGQAAGGHWDMRGEPLHASRCRQAGDSPAQDAGKVHIVDDRGDALRDSMVSVIRHFLSMRVAAVVFIGHFNETELAHRIEELSQHGIPHLVKTTRPA